MQTFFCNVLHLPYLIPNTSPITIYGVDRDNNDVKSDRYVCLASLLPRIRINSARNPLRPGSIYFMIAPWVLVCNIFVAIILTFQALRGFGYWILIV